MNVDGLSVRDEGDALRLMVYHLELAARLFECTPENLGAHLSAPGVVSDFTRPAVLAWAEALDAQYPDD